MHYLFQVSTIISGLLACLNRIQAFLILPERDDPRKFRTPGETASAPMLHGNEKILQHEDASLSAIEKETGAASCISLTNVSVAAHNIEGDVLSGLTLSIPTAKLTMVVGPVGSGKSVFLKTIIGEIRIRTGKVEITTADIGYCDQDVWLPNLTLQDTVISKYPMDTERYTQVINACALDHDITQFAQGHDTLIGPNGSKLSGGQRQRLALARALYSFTSVVVCDDILSALDRSTTAQLFSNVFGPHGILKAQGRTAILASHAVEWVTSADQVIEIRPQGTAQMYNDSNAISVYAESIIPTHENAQTPGQLEATAVAENNELEYALRDINNPANKMNRALYKYLFQAVPRGLVVLFCALIAMVAFLEKFAGRREANLGHL